MKPLKRKVYSNLFSERLALSLKLDLFDERFNSLEKILWSLSVGWCSVFVEIL